MKIHTSQILEPRVCKPHGLSALAFLLFAIMLIFLTTPMASASATNIYIAQNSAGAANGADCADALPVAFFNASANWGNGSNQIGPGTTVHLCATFTASGGASGYLTFQASGTSGSPITLHFETDAVLTAPYWGTSGAINGNDQSYIVIDGGTNGTVQATANGTGLANQQDGAGIYFPNVSNSEIKNLTVSNIYVHAASPDDRLGQSTFGIEWLGGSNVKIDNNIVHDMKWGVFFAYTTSSNILIYSNTIHNVDHGIVDGDESTGDIQSGSNCSNGIYGNTIYNFSNWDDAEDDNHHDGIHTWANNAPGSHYYVCVYSNYIYGAWGATDNTGIAMESDEISSAIFNNLIVPSSGTCASGAIGLFTGSGSGGSGALIVNNTVVNLEGNSGPCVVGIGVQESTSVTLENNIVIQAGTYAYAPTSGTFSTVDYNSYGTPAGSSPFYGSLCFAVTFSVWQSGCSFDLHGQNVSIALTGTYTPSAGSAVIGAAKNLTSLGITALNTDKTGVARPSSGAWDAGAYQSQLLSSQPNPPTGLVATLK